MKPIILGAGLAGLTTALALSPMPAVLVSPCTLGNGCSSSWAQGGIAAAIGSDDSAVLHAEDTIAVGSGLNDQMIVQQVANDGFNVIKRLLAYGVNFDHDTQGNLLLGLEAAHRRRRIVHAQDATGRAITEALIKSVRATPSLEIIENATIQDLLIDKGVAGVVLRRGHETIRRSTRQVVLATGGAAGLWRDTTNPHENSGGGLALAARAGATLGDLEFLQFHPTAIDVGRDPMPLASEALRGEGALLIDETGARFTQELQSRDILAREIWQHIAHGHKVFLDARQAFKKSFAVRFPTINALCAAAHIDPATDPIPVRPAAHYHMGGVITDAHGRTDIAGLWACGEVACTGLHGANRLASNSLLEAASFAWKVAEDIASSYPPKERSQSYLQDNSRSLMAKMDWPLSPATIKIGHMNSHHEIRAMMSDTVGVMRDQMGLEKAIAFLSTFAQHSDTALVGLIIATCALRRTESRGAHYRRDYPLTNEAAQRSLFKFVNS